MPFDNTSSHRVVSLEDFATSSNSDLVYACDKFGNQIAVGVFIKSSESGKEQNYEIKHENFADIADNPINPTSQWVAAIEECATENPEEPCTRDHPSASDPNPIRIYKVQKGTVKKNSKLGRASTVKCKTLKDFKNAICLNEKSVWGSVVKEKTVCEERPQSKITKEISIEEKA